MDTAGPEGFSIVEDLSSWVNLSATYPYQQRLPVSHNLCAFSKATSAAGSYS